MAYPPISTLPTPPSRQDPTNFTVQADAFLGALPAFQTQLNAAGDYIEGVGAAVDADASAAAIAAANASASAASAAQVASAWVSGGSYTVGSVRYSPINFSTYRAKLTHSGLTTDPSLDTTNWASINAAAALTDFGVTATAAELNYNDITTLGTSQASKVVTADANGDVKFAKAIIETVFALSGTTPALNPNNGTVQTWTLSGASTPTDSFVAGEAVTLMIDDGAAFTITWPSVTWKTDNGVAPILNTTGFTAIVLWKVGSILYGARVGDA
jgi:hypothetical protein